MARLAELLHDLKSLANVSVKVDLGGIQRRVVEDDARLLLPEGGLYSCGCTVPQLVRRPDRYTGRATSALNGMAIGRPRVLLGKLLLGTSDLVSSRLPAPAPSCAG